jgi:hypothetical protein
MGYRVLDTVHVSVISQGLYQYVIKDFGEYSKLVSVVSPVPPFR